ncbi:hypothetical protein GCM10020254_19150 [Streptomyces goshikiensis]
MSLLLLAPRTRLSLLVLLLAAAGACVLLYEPQRILSEGWPPGLPVGAAALLFAAAYGLCTAAFVPRPLLNLAAGGPSSGPRTAWSRRSAGRCWAPGSPSVSAGSWARRRCVRTFAGAG